MQATARNVDPDDIPVLYIRLLGGFRMQRGAQVVDQSGWTLRKSKSVLKLLALSPGYRVHRGHLMEYLWPDLSRDSATNNLHKALHTARYALEPDLRPGEESTYLHVTPDFVFLGPGSRVSTDIREFEDLVRTARMTGSLADYEEAARAYTGELLPEDRYEEWLLRHRERLASRYTDMLLGIANIREAMGDRDFAIETLYQIVATDPAHEEAQIRLMRLLALAGRRQLAMRHFHQLAGALAEEGAEPNVEAKRLFQQILSGETPTETSPAQVGVVHDVPDRQVWPLVGRDVELGEVNRAIDNLFAGRGGVLAITGEPGVGKSRLAAETLDRAAQRGAITMWGAAYADAGPYDLVVDTVGRFAVRVAPDVLRDLVGPSGWSLAPLVPAIARAFGLRQATPSRPAIDRNEIVTALSNLLGRLARSAPVVIVLENLETADEESVKLLGSMTPLLQHFPALGVVTIRKSEVPQGTGICRVCESLRTDGLTTHLELGPLDAGDTELLLSKIVGGSVDREMREVAFGISQGNPYAIGAVAKVMHERESLIWRNNHWSLRPNHGVLWGSLDVSPSSYASGDVRLADLLRTS